MEIMILWGFSLCAVIAAFMLGFKNGMNFVEDKKAIKKPVFGGFNPMSSKHVQSEEERKLSIELENIENYATCKPQKEVM
jgi:hypothetical protein